MVIQRFKSILILSILLAFLLNGCGRVRVDESWSAADLWAVSLNYFERERYLDASEFLTSFSLNHSGSTLIDSAQYMLAECHFMMKEYIIAESEYNRLMRNFPESSLFDDAWFKIILCNFYMSPYYQLDQKYTERAVQAVRDFLDEYSETDITVRLAYKSTNWENIRQVLTLGIWRPGHRRADEVSLYRTKVVLPHRSITFGQWMLRFFTIGLYKPAPSELKIPPSTLVDGDWIVEQALMESRSQLAKKTYRSAELYYKLKKYPSTVIYCGTVIEQFEETQWAPKAMKLRGDANFKMHKYDEALSSYQRYLLREDAVEKKAVEDRIDEINTILASVSRSAELEEEE
ncbi:outer membrane protein assembly factor BamD [bacterium]|nr:outer membrane protein assembly factor BamD [bacterium]